MAGSCNCSSTNATAYDEASATVSDGDDGGASLLPVMSLWMQLAYLFAVMAGIQSDLLVIRFCLFVAYGMILVNAVFGRSPSWLFWHGNDSDDEGEDDSDMMTIQLDALIWATICVYIHGASLASFLIDERRVEFKSDDEEALWRMLYRIGGLSARLYQNVIAKHLSIDTIECNDLDDASAMREKIIETKDHFYILFKGKVRIRIFHRNKVISDRRVRSGEMFDLKNLELIYKQDEKGNSEYRVVCTPETREVKLFRFHKDDMVKIAHHPHAKGVWQSLLIHNLSILVTEQLESEWEQRQRQKQGPQRHKPGAGVAPRSMTPTAPPPTPSQSVRTLNSAADGDTEVVSVSDIEKHFFPGATGDVRDAYQDMDPIFAPLKEWERPHKLAAGSGEALKYPIRHFFRCLMRSLNLPFPFKMMQQKFRNQNPGSGGGSDGAGEHWKFCASSCGLFAGAGGIRQALLPPPPARPPMQPHQQELHSRLPAPLKVPSSQLIAQLDEESAVYNDIDEATDYDRDGTGTSHTGETFDDSRKEYVVDADIDVSNLPNLHDAGRKGSVKWSAHDYRRASAEGRTGEVYRRRRAIGLTNSSILVDGTSSEFFQF